MRSRSIDNYLSTQDIALITKFIHHSIERFEKYNGRIRMAPNRFNTDELQKLYIVKYNEWDKATRAHMPDSSATYLEFIRKSSGPYPCPIEQFLKTFMQIIEQSIPPNRLQNMMQKMENELTQCIFLCPYPSEPKN